MNRILVLFRRRAGCDAAGEKPPARAAGMQQDATMNRIQAVR